MRNWFRQMLQESREVLEEVARKNTHLNENGYATISRDDQWFYEDEWDEEYQELAGKSGGQ